MNGIRCNSTGVFYAGLTLVAGLLHLSRRPHIASTQPPRYQLELLACAQIKIALPLTRSLTAEMLNNLMPEEDRDAQIRTRWPSTSRVLSISFHVE